MADQTRHKKTDLVLSNGEYAFTQDSTTGSVKVLSGPTVVNVTGQEYPVLYDSEEKRFRPVNLEDASQKSPMAAQGFYIELWNPPATESGTQPSEGSKENAPSLSMGQRVNIPGPTTFSLWPRQVAKVIEGHHLRSNQYLLGRVYDEEAAKENWQKAVLKTRAEGRARGSGAERSERESDPVSETPAEEGTQGTITELTEADLSVGKLFVIKGTEVSFYIPPTGVEVVPDEDGKTVRDALTLERLQYCILVDETGDKDYQRGPRVVFPKPTQRFFRDVKTDSIVFRPTELNPIQGIHVKVIAPYEENDRRFAEGEELFITGKETSIYFPRPEHSLIRYDGNAKHFATAIPEGEARYVMDRNSGVIRTVKGPTMLLPDPRTEVIVRRVLSAGECELWYPGNDEVRKHNEGLRALLGKTPSTRSAVSEGEIRRNRKQRRASMGMADQSNVHSGASGAMADEWQRAATFSEPRSLTLDTKYVGIPTIAPWTGYAVMVVNKRGERRVEKGPLSIPLEYDETLEVLELSTAVPKTSDRPRKVVYLQVENNHVSDLVVVETKDHVHATIRLTMRVDFTGEDPAKWFSVPDYVKLLCDRVRGSVKERVRTLSVDEFYGDPVKVVRDAVLGPENGVRPSAKERSDEGAERARARSRDGLLFTENAMKVAGIEVLSTKIGDAQIAKLFDEARSYSVSSAIGIGRAQKKLEIDTSMEIVEREHAEALAETDRFKDKLLSERIERDLELTERRIAASIQEFARKLEEQRARDVLANETAGQERERDRLAADLRHAIEQSALQIRVAETQAQTDAAVARFKAAEGPVAEAIQLLGNQDILAKVAEAVSAQRLFGGKDVSDVVGKLFEGTHLAPLFERIQRKAIADKKNSKNTE